SNAITGAATYDTVALDVEVGVISSFGRRYLEAIQAFDQLMPMLRTLEIYEVLSPKDLDARRAHYKKLTRRVVTAARELGKGLRKRMNELAAKEAGGGEANEVPTGTPRGDTRPGELREERSDWPGDEMTEEQKTPPAVLRAHGSPPALPPAAPHLATLPACQAEEQKAA
ncbi:MAG TPA: hypothetical protein VFR86_26595, partial [Burkholderiaceae bacterium]|nr:hypothetical protein [Burkholderiaceae bacterium]